MKKSGIILILLFVYTLNSYSQSYKENKLIYDQHLYQEKSDDPNNIFACGVASYFIPGLGQILAGETGRGLTFIGCDLACNMLFFGGSVCVYSSFLNSMIDIYNYDQFDYSNQFYIGLGSIIVGLTGMIFVKVYSVFDAVKVAKINNMYFQDHKNETGVIESIQLKPYVSQISLNNRNETSVGLSLNITF